MSINTNKNSGFSLVEVLVAVTILLLVIAGPFSIISRSINSTNYATEQVNAWFLAQEGLELMQKGRDNFVLLNFSNPAGNPNPMTSFLTAYNTCLANTGCGATIGNGSSAPINLVSCGVLDNCRLHIISSINTDRSSYQHQSSGNTPSPFTRVIKMERTPATGKVREIKVTSTVTWRTGALISGQKVEAVSYLFNVYDTN